MCVSNHNVSEQQQTCSFVSAVREQEASTSTPKRDSVSAHRSNKPTTRAAKNRLTDLDGDREVQHAVNEQSRGGIQQIRAPHELQDAAVACAKRHDQRSDQFECGSCARASDNHSKTSSTSSASGIAVPVSSRRTASRLQFRLTRKRQGRNATHRRRAGGPTWRGCCGDPRRACRAR